MEDSFLPSADLDTPNDCESNGCNGCDNDGEDSELFLPLQGATNGRSDQGEVEPERGEVRLPRSGLRKAALLQGLALFALAVLAGLRGYEAGGFGATAPSPSSISSGGTHGGATNASSSGGTLKGAMKAFSPPPSPARFVFLMGVEGTGHHLYDSLYDKSPAKKCLVRWGIYPHLQKLGTALYNNYKKDHGIWSAPCSGQKVPKVKDLFDNLVRILKDIDGEVRKMSGQDKDLPPGTTTVVPLNSKGPGTGEMSYPNFSGGCRVLQYPDVDVLYEACDAAGVWCEHIMVHRDPYEVMRSTSVNRHFGTPHVELRTHATMLDVINAQLLNHPDRLAACWDYDRTDGGIIEVGKIMGWEETNFTSFYKNLFRKPQPLNDVEKSKIVPPTLQVYMNTMMQAMERVKWTCNEQFRLKGR